MYFLIFLLPLVAAVPLKSVENYKIEIENGILKDVVLLGDESSELDLSSRGLVNIEKEAFDNVRNLKSLNLANNSLTKVPDFVFSNLTELEHLNLAQNRLDEVKYLFVGLETLKTVNISYNPMPHLRRGHLFGLTRTTDIFTEGNNFWTISTGVFENSFLKEDEEMKAIETINGPNKPKDEENDSDMSDLPKEARKMMIEEYHRDVKCTHQTIKLKLCKNEEIVASLEVLEEDEKVGENCMKVFFQKDQNVVILGNLGIKGFKSGWYRLDSLPVSTLDLSNNEITEITKETLNELPSSVTYVNFYKNKIRKISKNVIENEHLGMLSFKDNLLEEIEQDAFAKTKVTGLYLSGNQLQDLGFVTTLPETLAHFILTNSPLTSILDGVFSRFPNLLYLNLAGNKIEKLQDNVFNGLKSVKALVLTRNNIKEIEPKAFYGLKGLKALYVYRNCIEDLKKGTFADLENLKQLDLSRNKLSKITKDMFTDLSRDMKSIHLDHNEIEVLEEGSFYQTPSRILSLSHNKISNISKGVFDLPNLTDLYLNKNQFETIDGDSFEGLPLLRNLRLSGNKINKIEKGSCKNLGSLYVLDISKNPFERLENGALHGLPTIIGTYINIYDNQLKLMQGGLFDDV